MSGPPSRRVGSGHHCATSGGRGMRPGRRAGRRPFGGLPACIECHPVRDRGSFEDVPCFGRNRRHYIASSPVPDDRDAGAWRSPPFQRNNETDRRIETILGALCRHGEVDLLAGPIRQKRNAPRPGAAPDAPTDQAPVVPRKGLLGRRIVVSRPPALRPRSVISISDCASIFAASAFASATRMIWRGSKKSPTAFDIFFTRVSAGFVRFPTFPKFMRSFIDPFRH